VSAPADPHWRAGARPVRVAVTLAWVTLAWVTLA